MPNSQLEQSEHRRASLPPARRRPRTHPRMPSTAGYMLASIGLSFALFLSIWFLLRTDGDEAPWLPAGVAAGFVILTAAAAREVVMRRAWARYTREMEVAMGAAEITRPTVAIPRQSSAVKSAQPVVVNRAGMQSSIAALRNLQQRLAELDAPGTPTEAHLEAYRTCEQHLAASDEVLRSSGGAAELRVALRSAQERVRASQKKHLLLWARGEATRLTQEAQRRVRLADKIETAQRALEVLDEALKVYPGEQELRDSSGAVRDFIASVKVGQWVEMAERSAFRGKYGRAIARYRDALFYLSRADMNEDARAEAASRIHREIELLRARLATSDLGVQDEDEDEAMPRSTRRPGGRARTASDESEAAG